MSSKPRVLLLGATGETGASILNGLLESKNFEVEVMVRPQSAESPGVQSIKAQGVKVHLADLGAPESELVSILSNFDTVISAIGPQDLLKQTSLVKAAKSAGVKRFVPCAFITVAPPDGVLLLRDEKEVIYNEIKRLGLPYTIIDVGFWYQISYPRVPSGRVDYAMRVPGTVIHGDGTTPNIITDLRDIGRFVSRIIVDKRTLNKYVYTWGEVLSENEIVEVVEELSGETVEKEYQSAEAVEKTVEDAVAALSSNPDDPMSRINVFVSQYHYSKYIRGDNSPRCADFLGYLDARELYPDFKPITFRDFFVEVLNGKGKMPYGK